MATILQFPTAHARAMRDPAVGALREQLRPLADLAERLGPLSANESAGLRTLTLAVASRDQDRIDLGALPDYLAADIDGETWKGWPRAVRRAYASTSG